jgi:hypothetical protein
MRIINTSLESLQKMAMNIIFGQDDYGVLLNIAGADMLRDRSEKVTERFFRRNVLEPTSYLHFLSPPPSGCFPFIRGKLHGFAFSICFCPVYLALSFNFLRSLG